MPTARPTTTPTAAPTKLPTTTPTALPTGTPTPAPSKVSRCAVIASTPSLLPGPSSHGLRITSLPRQAPTGAPTMRPTMVRAGAFEGLGHRLAGRREYTHDLCTPITTIIRSRRNSRPGPPRRSPPWFVNRQTRDFFFARAICCLSVCLSVVVAPPTSMSPYRPSLTSLSLHPMQRPTQAPTVSPGRVSK